MKPLLFNTYADKGGAAQAVSRIFTSIRQQLPESKLVIQQPANKLPQGFLNISNRKFNTIRPYLDFSIGALRTFRRSTYFPAAVSSPHLYKCLEKEQPDIIHFNWMQGGYFDFGTKTAIIKPLIWTFHDLWPITGGCSYPGTCKNYLTGCGNCPLFVFKSAADLSQKAFAKRKAFFQSNNNIHIVTPSNWLKNTIIASPMLKNTPISVIPNGIDTNQFFPYDKAISRKELGIETKKKIIVFGAIGATTNKIKGFDILLDALKRLDSASILLIVFGATVKPNTENLETHYFPFINDAKWLNKLYSAADVMVIPSRQEVFGQTALEAMAAATPVVAFDNSGPADMVIHKENGFLANPFEPESLADGIQWVLNQPDITLGINARNTVVEKFDISLIADQYIHLYKKLFTT